MARYPDFLFIGAMKCATTTLSAQLGVQPGIFTVSNPKELFFFSYEHNYTQGIDWYQQHFEAASPDELCGEGATTYTQLPTYPLVVERMQQHIPHAKLIYVMRHPIDRLVSQYLHEFTLHNIQVDINSALECHRNLVHYSSYAMQLKPYLETFGAENVLPIFFENVKQNPQTELEKIGQFIGYKGSPQWQFDIAPKNVTSQRMIQHPILKFVRKSKLLKPLREHLVPKSIKEQMKNRLANNLERPTINNKQMASLTKTFDRDLAQLGQWLGMELNCNNFVSQVQSNEWSGWHESAYQIKAVTATALN